MTLVSRSLPGLFGGVSQQVPAMRHETQCSVQDNGLATLVDGLYKRHGTKRLASLVLNDMVTGNSVVNSYGNAMVHVIEQAGQQYALILVNGNVMLYSLLTGTMQTVSCPQGKAYLSSTDPGQDFRCVTVADYTFIVNRTQKVAMMSTASPENPVNVAYVHVRTAVPSTHYRVTLNGTPYSITSASDGTATASSIALGLRALFDIPGYTAAVINGTNIIRIRRDDGGEFTCTVSDGWSNTAMQAVHRGVDTFAQLPPVFETGFTVKVNGQADQGRDPYYVKWDGSRWVETVEPGLITTLNDTTMPHQLRPDGAGGWVFERVAAWGQRGVGSESTNPVPSFVGESIRGVFFFRNRLGFLAADAVVLSRAGAYFNFWASSATQVVATDPIDLAAPSEEVQALEWATPFNENLLVWSSTKQQFILTAGEVLTPETARLAPSTTFEVNPRVRPASIGNMVMFATTVGSNTQLNLYRVSEDRVTNSAEDLTEHVPKFVPAEVRQIAASSTVKMAAVIPSAASNVISLFKYELDDNDRLKQRAWQRIVLGTTDTVRVMRAHWVSRKLYLVLHVMAGTDALLGGRFVIETLDFEEQAQDPNAPIGIRLDSRVLATAGAFDGTTTRVTVPYPAVGNLVYLRCIEGQEPQELVPTAQFYNPLTNFTEADLPGDQRGATLWAGRPFMFRYTFTEVFLRDDAGLPVMAAVVKLVRMAVRYVATGWFKATVKHPLRGTYEYPFSGRSVGLPGQGPSQLALSTGELGIPVQARAAGVEVTLESDSWLPCKFPYAEWSGDVTMKASR